MHDREQLGRAIRRLVVCDEGDRVVGRVRRDAGDVASCRADQIDAHGRVVDRRLGQRMRNDHAGTVDTQMELLPASYATPAVFRGSHSPSPTTDSPVLSTIRRSGPFAGRLCTGTSSD